MARYRKIDTRIWNDEKFRALGDDGKFVFFVLLTHPHMTSIGAMRATLPGLASEIGWDVERLSEAFAKASSKGMAKHDAEASIIWLPKFIKYNEPESPNVLKAWAGAIDLLPECDLTREAIQSVKDFAEGLSKGFQEALPEAFRQARRQPSLYPEQEPEQEQEPRTETAKSIVGQLPDAPSPSPKEKLSEVSKRVLGFLNEKTGRNYRPVDANLKMIAARLREGATEAEMRQVVAKKSREWSRDEKMEPYLRPATLFNATKFAQYQGELVVQPEVTRG